MARRRKEMSKKLMNEAERYLIQNWAEATLFQEAMEGVREKYKELFSRIVEVVCKEHPELDAHRFAVTQSYTDGCVGFGRRSWPGGEGKWFSGLWLNGLRIEELSTEDSDPPYASLWVSKEVSIDFNSA